MRSIFVYVCFSLLCTLGIKAQENVDYGFLNVIHAVPEGGVCQIKIDGTVINEQGFQPGNFTGGLVLSAGTHSIEIEFKGDESATGSVNIVKNKTSAYAIFNHSTLDPKSKEEKNSIRIVRIQPKISDRFELTAMSLHDEVKRIRVAERIIDLKPLQLVAVEGWTGVPFSVSHGAEKLGSLEAEEKGSYVILVGRNQHGKHGVFFFRHFDFELPAWFKSE